MLIDAIVEIPMGTRNKYEVDHNTGKIRLNRVLYSSVGYPCEYGYIENTLADDGDPLDILVLSSTETFPGCIIESRVLGYLDIVDNGDNDEKVISVVNSDPRWNHIQKLEDLPEHTIKEIKEFFKTYKHLQDIQVEIGELHGLEETKVLIEECKNRFEDSKNNVK